MLSFGVPSVPLGGRHSALIIAPLALIFCTLLNKFPTHRIKAAQAAPAAKNTMEFYI